MSTRSLSLMGLGLAVGSVALYYAWRRKNRNLRWEEVGRVTDLYIYPVKSGRGVRVQTATATPYGLRSDSLLDRSFVVVMTTSDKKVQVTSSMVPLLSTVKMCVLAGGCVQFTSAKSDRKVTVDLQEALRSELVKFYMITVEARGFDCGEEVATWLREFLYPEKEPSSRPVVQMVYVGSPENCKIPAAKPDIFPFPQFRDTDSRLYHDACAYLLTSTSSLDDLNSRLETPVTMLQLRGNIVVTGQPAFDEDCWAFVRIGDSVVMRTLKPREACVRVNVNADNGTVQTEVLNVLKKYRVPPMPAQLAKHWSQKPFFGLHMGLGAPGEIAVGDKVYAVRKMPHWLLRNQKSSEA